MSRPSGFLERYYACRLTNGYFNRGFNVSVCFNHHVDDAKLSVALKRVLYKYPLFTANLRRENDKDEQENGTNFVVRSQRVLFNDVVSHRSDIFNDALLESFSQVKIPVDSDLPTWRLMVVDSNGKQHISFLCNHALFDGNSAANFFEDLLEELAGVTNSEFESVLSEPVASLPPAVENLVPLYDVSKWFLFKVLLTDVLTPKITPRWVQTVINYFKKPFKAVPLSLDNESTFRTVHLDKSQMDNVLTHCRTKRLTVTPYMTACAHEALQDSLSLRRATQAITVVCGRRFHPNLAKETRYGLFMGQCETRLFNGDAAAKVTESLRNEFKTRHGFKMAGLLALPQINIWDYFKGLFRDPDSRKTIEVSNVGLKLIKKGNYEVEEMTFSQGVSSAHITISACSTLHGMTLVFALHKEMTRHIDVDGFVDRFRDMFIV